MNAADRTRDPEVNADPIEGMLRVFVETVISVVVGGLVLCVVGFVCHRFFGVQL